MSDWNFNAWHKNFRKDCGLDSDDAQLIAVEEVKSDTIQGGTSQTGAS